MRRIIAWLESRPVAYNSLPKMPMVEYKIAWMMAVEYPMRLAEALLPIDSPYCEKA